MDSLKGQLLLASPALGDPSFQRTVVLVGEHNDEGAMGLVLNRPSEVSVGDAVPQFEAALDGEEHVYAGGPVQRTMLVLLFEFENPSQAGLLIGSGIGFPQPDADLDELAGSTLRRRVFAGYAGWGPGQLESELERGDWITEPAAPGDIFSPEPQGLWAAILNRKGGRYALLARMPVDPSLN